MSFEWSLLIIVQHPHGDKDNLGAAIDSAVSRMKAFIQTGQGVFDDPVQDLSNLLRDIYIQDEWMPFIEAGREEVEGFEQMRLLDGIDTLANVIRKRHHIQVSIQAS